MENEKLIPFPVRLTSEDFISEMFLLSRIFSENIKILGFEVKRCDIFMLSPLKNAANIQIEMNEGVAVVCIDAHETKKILVSFRYQGKISSCFYAELHDRSIIDLVKLIND